MHLCSRRSLSTFFVAIATAVSIYYGRSVTINFAPLLSGDASYEFYPSATTASWYKSETGVRRYTRDIYRREMEDVIRNILEPAEIYSRFQHKGYARGLSMMDKSMLEGLQREVEDVVEAGIQGDVYEFGSWRGGASILMARVFTAYERLLREEEEEVSRNSTVVKSSLSFYRDSSPSQPRRKFWVFDTFDGFSKRQVGDDTLLQDLLLDTGNFWVAPLENVRGSFINFTSDEFVHSNVRFVPGLFEDSLLTFNPPGPVALLRLDGDLYESTRVVLSNMYFAVSRGGHVIVDDYNWNPEKWATDKTKHNKTPDRKICKHAVDEFRIENNITSRITTEYVRPSWIKDADATFSNQQ